MTAPKFERTERCNNCRFWDGTNATNIGACHRYPPTAPNNKFALTMNNDWCGEFIAALRAADRQESDGQALEHGPSSTDETSGSCRVPWRRVGDNFEKLPDPLVPVLVAESINANPEFDQAFVCWLSNVIRRPTWMLPIFDEGGGTGPVEVFHRWVYVDELLADARAVPVAEQVQHE